MPSLKSWLFPLLLTANTLYAATEPVDYKNHMRSLIKLSQQNPRYPFAAMIIDNNTGKVLCTGVNQSYQNPTFHGEMVAINNCAAKYKNLKWENTTLITDAEPCSMCASAMVWAKIPRLVFGSSVPSLLRFGWDQINIRARYVFDRSPNYHGTIIGGVLEKETDALFIDALKKPA